VAEALLLEGANVLAVARSGDVLKDFQSAFPGGQLSILPGDVTNAKTLDSIVQWSEQNQIKGLLVNAGGPPAGGISDLKPEHWDQAYLLVLRWKVMLSQRIAKLMMAQGYGRIVFIESVSVKQPVDNLVLSNTFRPAVVGFAKTLAQETAANGITVNVLAPGYHNTPAMQRLYQKKSELLGLSIEEAKKQFEEQILTGRMAGPEAMASLALWLLSPLSFYLTGQTISHDGGIIKGLFG
jgi:3-oxoacyl-[acyl-carrier protein] reductase